MCSPNYTFNIQGYNCLSVHSGAAEVEGGTPEAEDDQAVETKQVTVRSIRVRPTRQWSPNF